MSRRVTRPRRAGYQVAAARGERVRAERDAARRTRQRAMRNADLAEPDPLGPLALPASRASSTASSVYGRAEVGYGLAPRRPGRRRARSSRSVPQSTDRCGRARLEATARRAAGSQRVQTTRPASASSTATACSRVPPPSCSARGGAARVRRARPGGTSTRARGKRASDAVIVTVTLNAALDRTLTVPNFQQGHRHHASPGPDARRRQGDQRRARAEAPRRAGRRDRARGRAHGHADRRGADVERRSWNDFVRIE